MNRLTCARKRAHTQRKPEADSETGGASLMKVIVQPLLLFVVQFVQLLLGCCAV